MSTPIIPQTPTHPVFFPSVSQATYRDIASKWRKAHSQPNGVVYILDETVQGWSSELRPAEQWIVGVIAITAANEILEADGVYLPPRGAERWLLISESVPEQPQAEDEQSQPATQMAALVALGVLIVQAEDEQPQPAEPSHNDAIDAFCINQAKIQLLIIADMLIESERNRGSQIHLGNQIIKYCGFITAGLAGGAK
jgi:hypothetical protein